MEQQVNDIDKRLSIVETKIAEVPSKFEEVHTKIDNHQRKADDIGLRMYNVMAEIRNEITSYKIKNAEEEVTLVTQLAKLDTKIDVMSSKYQSIYKTVTVVAGIFTTVIAAVYSVMTLFID